jgi:hypothetical protein
METRTATLPESTIRNPLDFLSGIGGKPTIDFHWKEVAGKRRLIGNPNGPMRLLHERFKKQILGLLELMGRDGFYLRTLPSSTAFVKKSNPLKNAEKHIVGKFFYITDIADAYSSVDLRRLAVLLVYIEQYPIYSLEFSVKQLSTNDEYRELVEKDPIFKPILSFLEVYCSGLGGMGLAVGGPISPYLFNLYCEMWVDWKLRALCEKKEITYTRYADDLTFSRRVIIGEDARREIREIIQKAGFRINHAKSKVLSIEMGTVFVTKIGLRFNGDLPAILVYPQWKRRKLHGIIGSYLAGPDVFDWPEKVSGYVAEFLYYYKKTRTKTATDVKTFARCREFEREWRKYRHRR